VISWLERLTPLATGVEGVSSMEIMLPVSVPSSSEAHTLVLRVMMPAPSSGSLRD
jgi:hypothetical protein